MSYLIALALGAAAGAIDTLPMRGRGIPRVSIAAVFAQWCVVGLLIPFVGWPVAGWLKGMLIGGLGMIPGMIQLTARNPRAVLPTGVAGLVLGAGIGAAGALLIG